jgi:CBS domain-containing protein
VDIGNNLRSESVERAGVLEAVCVEPARSTAEVLRLLRDLGRGAVLICRGEKLEGIFTERDALRLLASGADLSQPIETVMTPNPISALQSDSIGAAISKMAINGYRRLPVVDDQGRPAGMLDVSGIVHWLVDHFPAAVYNLPPVANPATHEREGP